MTPLYSGPFFGRTFQAGYVTTDMDRALAVMHEKIGVGDYLRTGKVSFDRDVGGEVTMEIALAWAGDMMIEIIQPMAGPVEVFTDILPREGFGLKFHHIGIRLERLEQWNDMLAETAGRRHAHHMTITGSNSRCTYVDTYDILGHYIEYVYYKDLAKSNLGRVPQNVPGFDRPL